MNCKRLVVLENLALVEPVACLRVRCKLGLQVLLPLELAVQHLVRQRTVFRGDLVEQHQFGEAVAPVVEAPTVHARDQSAVRMLTLIEVGRKPAGDGDELRRCLHQIVRQSRRRVDSRIPIELPPSCVVMRDDVDHQVVRAQRLELVIAERVGEMQAQRRVLIHHDGEPRSAWGRGLDNHGVLSMKQETMRTAPAAPGGAAPAVTGALITLTI